MRRNEIKQIEKLINTKGVNESIKILCNIYGPEKANLLLTEVRIKNNLPFSDNKKKSNG